MQLEYPGGVESFDLGTKYQFVLEDRVIERLYTKVIPRGDPPIVLAVVENEGEHVQLGDGLRSLVNQDLQQHLYLSRSE